MKSFKIILFLLFFFSLQSCGGEDDGYIPIDLEQQNDNQNEEGDNNNTSPNDSIPTIPNDNINSSKAYLYYERFYSEGHPGGRG